MRTFDRGGRALAPVCVRGVYGEGGIDWGWWNREEEAAGKQEERAGGGGQLRRRASEQARHWLGPRARATQTKKKQPVRGVTAKSN